MFFKQKETSSMELDEVNSKQAYNYCYVPNCTSRGKQEKSVKFHKFPTNKQLTALRVNLFNQKEQVCVYDEWQRLLRIDEIKKSTRVCSAHFTPEDYFFPGKTFEISNFWSQKKKKIENSFSIITTFAGVPTKRQFLKKTAIPSRNLPMTGVQKKLQMRKEKKVAANNARELRRIKREQEKETTKLKKNVKAKEVKSEPAVEEPEMKQEVKSEAPTSPPTKKKKIAPKPDPPPAKKTKKDEVKVEQPPPQTSSKTAAASNKFNVYKYTGLPSPPPPAQQQPDSKSPKKIELKNILPAPMALKKSPAAGGLQKVIVKPTFAPAIGSSPVGGSTHTLTAPTIIKIMSTKGVTPTTPTSTAVIRKIVLNPSAQSSPTSKKIILKPTAAAVGQATSATLEPSKLIQNILVRPTVKTDSQQVPQKKIILKANVPPQPATSIAEPVKLVKNILVSPTNTLAGAKKLIVSTAPSLAPKPADVQAASSPATKFVIHKNVVNLASQASPILSKQAVINRYKGKSATPAQDSAKGAKKAVVQSTVNTPGSSGSAVKKIVVKAPAGTSLPPKIIDEIMKIDAVKTGLANIENYSVFVIKRDDDVNNDKLHVIL